PVKIRPLTRAIPPTHKDHQQEQWQQVIAHHYPKELTMNQEPKYLVQILERNEHFCKSFKLVTLANLPLWIEESQAVIEIVMKYNPTHSYVMYISNNPVDLAKGESKLIQQEAIKKLKGETSKVGITTSTKAMYLGMKRDICSFDFDDKINPELLVEQLLNLFNKIGLQGEYTLTPNGMHLHIAARDKELFMYYVRDNALESYLDKVGHDLCSPIAGTYKDGYLITKHKLEK
ncbi:hypothetical protein OAP32_00385, partial [Crocinitomicaceae bacterium]|nr:hypothetical protein [Crocinitomicaceae bacterium]